MLDDLDAMIALIGVISGGFIATAVYMGQRRQAKLSLLVALIREFNSASMHSSRIKAELFLRDKLGERYDKMYLGRTNDQQIAEITHLWLVYSFYERLSILLQQRELPSSIVFAVFGETFYWWWGYSFEHQLPDKWTATREIKRLHLIMSNHFRASSDYAAPAMWEERGREHRATITARVPLSTSYTASTIA